MMVHYKGFGGPLLSVAFTLRDKRGQRCGDVIRLSLSKLSVNLVQAVKRTNTPLIPQQMASSAGLKVFWVVGSNATSTIIIFFRLSPCRT